MTDRVYNWSAAAAAAAMVLTMVTPSHAQTAARDGEGAPLRAPTAAEAQALAPTAETKAPRIGMVTGKVNPEPIVHRDGTVELELDASTMSYTVARVNPDGSISKVCVNGEQAAQKAMKAKSPRVKVTAAKGYFHDVK
jgi:hypothetical protein